MTLSRRQLINTGAATSAVVVAGLASSATAAPSEAPSAAPAAGGAAPFGPLVADPQGRLALPAGFRYEVVAVTDETTLAGGAKTPARPDGTLVVATASGYRLVQNHEVTPGSGDTPVPQVGGTVYDPGALGGGCTVIDVGPTGTRVRERVGLSGTVGNCAGGPTPWDSWLTCEETESKAGTNGYEKDHGYVFEVFAAGPGQQLPEPIEAWGRFPHEAVVIEPNRRRAYLTEDASGPNGLLYRWTAPSGRRLTERIAESFGPDDGILQALAVVGDDGEVLPDLAYLTSAQLGRPFATQWITVPDRHARSTSTRNQIREGRVTRGKKLEGAWGDDQGMYFVSSFATEADIPSDATPHDGQLWYYRYAQRTLTLVAYFPYNAQLHEETPGWEESLGRSLDLAFDGPDGCHVSPYGALILTEDGNTANHALAWTRQHGAVAIARNEIVLEQSDEGGNVYSEMTGPCFSPDGRLLFVNIQEPGHVFAIRGPWKKHLG